MPAAWRDRAIRECDGGLQLLADLAGWPVAAGAPVTLCRDLMEASTHAAAAVDWFRSYLAGREAADETRYAAGHGLLALLLRRGTVQAPVAQDRAEAPA